MRFVVVVVVVVVVILGRAKSLFAGGGKLLASIKKFSFPAAGLLILTKVQH